MDECSICKRSDIYLFRCVACRRMVCREDALPGAAPPYLDQLVCKRCLTWRAFG